MTSETAALAAAGARRIADRSDIPRVMADIWTEDERIANRAMNLGQRYRLACAEIAALDETISRLRTENVDLRRVVAEWGEVLRERAGRKP